MKRQSICASLLVLLASWSLFSGTVQAQTPATVGQWSLGPVWDITPINMLVLPSGKVMFYPGYTIYGDDARMWDPATNTLTSLAKAGYDLFCSGHSFLTDGTILISGGTVTNSTNVGLTNASIYNPVTNVWTRTQDMQAGRWYPSSTTTATGDVLVLTGRTDANQTENPLPQVWQASSGTWRSLTNALLAIWTYPWVYWTPSGKAIVVGPEPPTRYLDISGTGAWTTPTSFNFANTRDYGSSVLYSSSKILIAGGSDPPTNTAEIFDLNTGTWTYTNSMAFPRRQYNLVLLPDDNVLAVGGTSGPGFNDQTSPVYASEMWNPSTKAWTTMASQTVGRFYHSVAVLLPDGRVLSGGGTDMYQTEIYSPPYLFKGARPSISSAPTSASYGSPFFVGTPDATSIANVRLMRLAANTHAFDQNQRTVTVSFTQATGGLNLTAPSDPNLAPPGHYMLFLLNGSGVPSVAKIIMLGGTAPPPPPPAAPTNLVATAASSTSITLTWADQSNNEDIFKIERALGTGAFSQVAAVGANVTTYTDTGLAAGTSYSYRVRASNSGGDSSYSNTATATTQASGGPSLTLNGGTAPITVAPGATITITVVNPTGNSQDWIGIYPVGANAATTHSVVEHYVNWTTYTIPSTTPVGTYEARLFSNNSLTLLATSAAITVSTGTSPPAAPSGLAVTAVTSTSINLTWVDNSTNETGFKIERALGTGAFSQVATAGAGATIYTDTGLTANTSYSYRVRATNAGGDSAYSNTTTATTLPTAPAAPSGLTATAATSTSINLTWVRNSTNETGFKIERALGTGAFSQVATAGAGATTYTDTGLTANTSYSYRVRATNSGGDSAYSNTATATTQAAGPPLAPSGLSATTSFSTSMTLTWTDNSTNETSFKIERALGAGAFSQVATVGAGVITYTDTGLSANTTYSYRVRASNGAGDSAYSNTATATTLPAVPAAPSGLVATAASSSAINLSWVSNSTNETSFKIERALGAGAFSQVGTVGAGVTTYADSGLTAGTTYSYRVRASNSGGDSAYSNTATATTTVTAPAAPTGLVATAASSTAINLTWVSNSTNETSFKIERALGAGAFSQVGTVGAGVTSYADSGLTAGTTYSYRVRASNSAGDSAYSNTATATTPTVTAPAAPSGLVATAASSTAINLTWVRNSTNETSFKIERALGAGAFSQVATVGAGVTTYADSGLTANTTYSYRVRASNSGGDSAYSNTATAKTLAATAPYLTLNGGVAPITVAPGATITITVVHPTGNSQDWIGIYPVGANAATTHSVVEHYVNWTTYTIPSTTPAGAYEARLFSNNSLTVLETSATITVSQ